jgi:hypothetical protein
LSVPQDGAQRASSRRSRRLTALGLGLALVAAVGMINPTPSAAAGVKVVVIVGPAGASTAKYIYYARRYAAQARAYGASVVEIYSPNATWTRVKAAAQGAKVLIYLGHGNGSPSPYGPFNKYTKDGFGLNRTAGAGNYNTRYWGEYYIDTQIRLAPNAVVIHNHLCYPSGNSDWGAANPTRDVAKKRADNFATGFLRAGARAVFAEGLATTSYILYGLFRTSRTISAVFRDPARWHGAYDFQFQSVRNPVYRVWMDPSSPSRYYRSVVGSLGMSATTFRSS